MNSNRKILCGAAALLISAGFFGASFLIPELSDHINRLGNGNLLVYGAMLLIFCLVFLVGMLLTERWETGTWMNRKNKKVNKQTVILKGIHATPEGEKVIREYEKEGVQNGVYRVSKIED